MFNNKIKKEVMRVINARIEDAEEDYRDECNLIDAEAIVKKEEALHNAVQSIVGKIL